MRLVGSADAPWHRLTRVYHIVYMSFPGSTLFPPDEPHDQAADRFPVSHACFPLGGSYDHAANRFPVIHAIFLDAMHDLLLDRFTPSCLLACHRHRSRPYSASYRLACPPAAAIRSSPRRLVSQSGAKSVSSPEQSGIGTITANLIKTAIYTVFFFVYAIRPAVILKCK